MLDNIGISLEELLKDRIANYINLQQYLSILLNLLKTNRKVIRAINNNTKIKTNNEDYKKLLDIIKTDILNDYNFSTLSKLILKLLNNEKNIARFS